MAQWLIHLEARKLAWRDTTIITIIKFDSTTIYNYHNINDSNNNNNNNNNSDENKKNISNNNKNMTILITIEIVQ